MDAKTDRAEQRRKAVGSSCEYEKTKTASLNTYVKNNYVSHHNKNSW